MRNLCESVEPHLYKPEKQLKLKEIYFVAFKHRKIIYTLFYKHQENEIEPQWCLIFKKSEAEVVLRGCLVISVTHDPGQEESFPN